MKKESFENLYNLNINIFGNYGFIFAVCRIYKPSFNTYWMRIIQNVLAVVRFLDKETSVSIEVLHAIFHELRFPSIILAGVLSHPVWFTNIRLVYAWPLCRTTELSKRRRTYSWVAESRLKGAWSRPSSVISGRNRFTHMRLV